MTLRPDEQASRKAAYLAIRRALRTGALVRGTACERCQPLHGHHRFGYDRPLDVVWLCQTHHVQEHQHLKNGATVVNDVLVPAPPTRDDHVIAYHEALIEMATRNIETSRRAVINARRRIRRLARAESVA